MKNKIKYINTQMRDINVIRENVPLKQQKATS
jgi:hypothetical protein